MREIWFRGKWGRTWIYGNLQHSSTKETMYIDNYTSFPFQVIPETVGQFTGLTDKNGNKIFEGDIVKAKWRYLSNTDTVIGVVKYDNADFILETDEHYLFFEDNIFSYECEVIGNIHDNPELLNEK